MASPIKYTGTIDLITRQWNGSLCCMEEISSKHVKCRKTLRRFVVSGMFGNLQFDAISGKQIADCSDTYRKNVVRSTYRET